MSMPGYFQEHFPDMQPISMPPSLWSAVGCGFMAYGARDFDQDSGTYVKTRFLTLLFLPLLAIDAYRVAPASAGWYFLGKVPLSNVTRFANLLFVLALLATPVGVWWHFHSNNPETIAANVIAEGDTLADEGKVGSAAHKYQSVATQRLLKASAVALDRLNQLFTGSFDHADANEVLGAISIGVDSFNRTKRPPNVFDMGLRQARLRAEADGATAWKVLNLIDPIAPHGDGQVGQVKKPILEKLLAAQPDNIDALSDLALVYESEKQHDLCEKLLAPKRESLGIREGARILGQIVHKKGDLPQAVALLEGYVGDRLKKLNDLNITIKRIDDRTLAKVDSGKAPGFDYKRFRALQHDRNAQGAMWKEYMDDQLFDDPEFQRLQNARHCESRAVPAAFELGDAYMRLAQTAANPQERQSGLEKAERTFVAIRGAAGENDRQRLYLGQVYYWLGKQAEGRKVFDDLLRDHKHAGKTIVEVAHVLREVGSVTEARKLCEDAYDKEIGGDKDNLARTRALLQLDLDDQILWLSRILATDTFDKALIARTRGEKARQENQDVEAEKHYREGLRHYASMPESYAQLNNSALIHFALYRLTGDVASIDQGIANLEKALVLQPRDSIVMRNIAEQQMTRALREVVGNAVDWRILKSDPSLEMLGYLYNHRAKKDQYRAQIRKSEGAGKARGHYDRVLVLAPRSSYFYSALANHYSFLQDREALTKLEGRAAQANLEHADALRVFQEWQEGKKIDQRIKDLENAVEADLQTVAAARKIGGATLAVALARLVRDKVSLQALDRPIDPNQLVGWAEEAQRVAPSHGTQNTLIDALLARAHYQLLDKDPLYAAQIKKHQHWLGTRHAIAIALGQDATQEAVLAHADVQRAAGLLKTQCDNYAEDFSEWAWAMLRHTEPEWTTAALKQWQQDEVGQASRALAKHLTAPTALETYRQYWALRMQGRDDAADALMRRNAEQGIPVTK